MDTPILQYIIDNLNEEGTLPDDFNLPEEEEGEGVKFADGALDGITIYHMGVAPLNEDDKVKFGGLITLAGTGAFDEAEAGLKDFCREHRAITIIDDLQTFIMENTDILDAGKTLTFAMHLLYESTDRELVKVGMSILELFDVYRNEATADAIRKIGLCNEFTIFAVFIVRRWPEGEKEILELAKEVRGWGRIHCVDFIDAQDDETKRWLLFNGVDNDVVPAYSAWNVYEKADVEGVLAKDSLMFEEMEAVLAIADALMDEGPVSGISKMDNPRAFLDKVIEKAGAGYEFSEEDERILQAAKEWKEE